MNKIMFTCLLLSLLGKAHADQDQRDLPYLAPDRCLTQKAIVLPSSVEGTSYYFNRDCSIAYIVPPPTASMEVSNSAMQSNMSLCPGVLKSKSTIVNLNTQIAQIAEKMALLDPTDSKFNDYQTSMSNLQNLINKLQNSYEKTAGMTVQLNLKSSLTSDYMKEILMANMPSIESGQLKIRPTPLAKSYLSFNNIIPGVTQTYDNNPVLESNVMGILSKADEKNTDRTSVRFNGGATGYVVLNLNGACPIVEGDFSHLSSLKLDSEKVGSYLSVTQTMMVSLLSSFGYKAKLDVGNAVDSMYNKFGRNGKFTSTEVTDLVLKGSLSEAITVESWTQETPEGNLVTVYNDNIGLENQKIIKQSLLQRYLAQLVQFNALKEVAPLATPAAGNDVQTGTTRQCWSSSSFFGLVSSGGCRDVAYQFLVPTDGVSDQRVNIINNLGALFTDSAEFLSPVTRVHTSAFVAKGVK